MKRVFITASVLALLAAPALAGGHGSVGHGGNTGGYGNNGGYGSNGGYGNTSHGGFNGQTGNLVSVSVKTGIVNAKAGIGTNLGRTTNSILGLVLGGNGHGGCGC